MIGARVAAASCFVWAAFALPSPGLDRAGVALIGLAFVALAIAPRVRPAPAAQPVGLGDFTTTAPDDGDVQLADFVQRVTAHTTGSPGTASASSPAA